MKKLIFVLLMFPAFLAGQITDLSKYHDRNKLWERTDHNFDIVNDSIDSLRVDIDANASALSGYQPLEATLTDIADGTITENLVNTTNPWADNEVADNITITNISQVADITSSAAQINALPFVLADTTTWSAKVNAADSSGTAAGSYATGMDLATANASIAINSTQLQDSLGWVYPESYGATPDAGTNDDALGITAAVEAAAARTYGGLVYIRSGLYNIKSAIPMLEKVKIMMDPYTILYVDNDFNGNVFESDGAGLQYFHLDGGKINSHPDAGHDWNAIRFFSNQTAPGGILRDRVSNVDISNCDTAIICHSSGDGWINGISFSDINITGANCGVALFQTGESLYGSNGNIFSNVQIYGGLVGTKGIYLDADRNVFSPLYIWDYGVDEGPENDISIEFADKAFGNTIVAGQLGWDSDSAYHITGNYMQNTIIADGMVMNQPRVSVGTLSHDHIVDTLAYIDCAYLVTNVSYSVTEAFNDSGTDTINCGTQYSDIWYINKETARTVDFFNNTGVYAVPSSHQAGDQIYIIANYVGENANATTGEAKIFFTWTPLLEGTSIESK